MKDKEVKIGEPYVARVSQRLVAVLILNRSAHNHNRWNTLNLTTGCCICRSSRQLRRPLTTDERIRLNRWLQSDKAKSKSSLLRAAATTLLDTNAVSEVETTSSGTQLQTTT